MTPQIAPMCLAQASNKDLTCWSLHAGKNLLGKKSFNSITRTWSIHFLEVRKWIQTRLTAQWQYIVVYYRDSPTIVVTTLQNWQKPNTKTPQKTLVITIDTELIGFGTGRTAAVTIFCPQISKLKPILENVKNAVGCQDIGPRPNFDFQVCVHMILCFAHVCPSPK